MTNTVVPSHMTTFVTMKNSMYQNSSLIKEVAFDRFYRGGGGASVIQYTKMLNNETVYNH
jgi:hypothetical protein